MEMAYGLGRTKIFHRYVLYKHLVQQTLSKPPAVLIVISGKYSSIAQQGNFLQALHWDALFVLAVSVVLRVSTRNARRVIHPIIRA